jgi:hypothetical protein
MVPDTFLHSAIGEQQMDLVEARRIMHDDGASWTEHCEAAATLSSSKEASLEDLIACLVRGGYAAEMAAGALHLRTKRERLGDGTFVTDPDDWRRYLGIER